ncbi:MAG: hypothetical protein AB9833_07810 [Bacteroidales bacterium]
MNILRSLILACIFSSISVFWPGFALSQDKNFQEKVEKAAKWQMENYPKSRLLDLYKNFFQDKFGPGHIVADTASAGAYIRRELTVVKGKSQVNYVETTGWEGKFVRVDMALLKDNIVSYPAFFDAFIKSTGEAEFPGIEQWSAEWNKIESIVRQLYPQIPNANEDSASIDKLLRSGNYAIHHSEEYSKAYDPHYRLVSRKIYENSLKPLIESHK